MKRFVLGAIAALFLMCHPAGRAQSDPEVEIRPLTEGVWLHTSFETLPDGTRFPSHGLIIRQDDALLLIDTAWGEDRTRWLLDAIAVQFTLPITGVVVTHFHGDRTGGVDLLESLGVEVWASANTQRLAIEHDEAVPDRLIDGLDEPGDAVLFGALEVFYPGPAHSMDNVMVWLEGPGVLFGGCAIRGAGDDSLGNTRDGDIEGWGRAMERTRERYATAAIVVPSHSEPGGPELIGHTAHLARQALANLSESGSN